MMNLLTQVKIISLKKRELLLQPTLTFISLETQQAIGTENFHSIGDPLKNRKILKNGVFSGKLTGFGSINSVLSTYSIAEPIEAPIDPPNGGEPNMYKLSIVGKIYVGTGNYCSIAITGNLYPWTYSDGFDGGLFSGTASTFNGVGKLKGMNNRQFNV